MSTLLSIVKFIVACLPFAVLLLATKKVNLKKVNRGRQVAMPVATLVYAIVVTVLLVWLGGDPFHLEDTFASLGAKLSTLLQENVEGAQNLSILENLEESVRAFVLKYLPFLTNAAIVLVFMVIKGILLPIFSSIWGKNPGLMEATSGFFYVKYMTRQWYALSKLWAETQAGLRHLHNLQTLRA